jgi:hypothetical protein
MVRPSRKMDLALGTANVSARQPCGFLSFFKTFFRKTGTLSFRQDSDGPQGQDRRQNPLLREQKLMEGAGYP